GMIMTIVQKRLSVAALVAFALCAVSFVPSVRNPSAPKAFQSALLNPAYMPDVDRIDIWQGASAVTLEKTDGQWTVTGEQMTFRADEKLVLNLLAAASSVRKMYVISDNDGRPSSASVGLSFSHDGTVYTKAYFFGENALTGRVMLSVSSQDALYETENDLSPFLHPTVRYWAKPELVQSVVVPQSFVWQEPGKPPVVIGGASPGFSRAAHDIMVLRHGAVVPAGSGHSVAAAELTVIGDGTRERIRFVPQDDGSFRCDYAATGDPLSERLSAAVEISGWTFERLQGIFSNSDAAMTAQR
ncbi:MAG: hypothetical protein K2I74_04675, partial [Treponemataceae bacterium]|nr:hypothetical protein [Treponemataceae bacterium]